MRLVVINLSLVGPARVYGVSGMIFQNVRAGTPGYASL